MGAYLFIVPIRVDTIQYVRCFRGQRRSRVNIKDENINNISDSIIKCNRINKY